MIGVRFAAMRPPSQFGHVAVRSAAAFRPFHDKEKTLHLNSRRALAAAAIALAMGATPSLADRVLSGAEAQQKLVGQTFEFNCVDGTRGEASYARSGVATASYRLAGAGDDAALQSDKGRVRANGDSVCIRWSRLNGGEEGCYRMTERRPGQYRIAEGQMRWCDLTSRGSGERAARN